MSTPSSDESSDQEILHRIFGGPVASAQPPDQLVWYIGLALITTLLFWLLTSLPGPLVLKAATFFLIVLGLNLIFSKSCYS